jgi:phosphatidylserine/phosphatidylglycerophosphate/cardiolipin synthase-like enzyme
MTTIHSPFPKGQPMFVRFIATILLTIAYLTGAATAADDDASLSSLADVVASVHDASSVILSAYTLSPRGQLARALAAAAGGGAHVQLVLDGNGMASATRDNEAAIPYYRNERIDASLSSEHLHLKALVASTSSGIRVYVSDRNWTSSNNAVFLRLPATMAPQIVAAIGGRAVSAGTFATRKSDALSLEYALLQQRRAHTVLVESESFGNTPITQLLATRARAGDDVTLIVARSEFDTEPRERDLLAALAGAGVHVYVGESDQKIAVDGTAAYIGSANNTPGWGDQIDFGYLSDNPQLVGQLANAVMVDKLNAQAVTR